MTGIDDLRVDHVGSLLRPKSLIEAFLARGRGEIDDRTLVLAQDEAIRDVVAKQQAIGLPVVSDGEYRRLNWQVSFSQVEGWDQWKGSWRAFLASPSNLMDGETPGTRGADAVEHFKAPATGKLTLQRNAPLEEFLFLKGVAQAPAKVMLMGPDRVSQMCDLEKSAPWYADRQSFLDDVAAIQNRMIGEIVEAGCSYVQLDEPSYTGYVDRATLERMAARGEDPMRNLGDAVAASNAAIDEHRGKACFGLHICRGNRASMWHREGTYDGIAEFLFANLAFDRLLLEYDTERAGGFEPLRFVPKGGPIVVLGLITTKTGALEEADALIARIDEAARFVDIGQLAIGPQCGFASGIGGNLLGEDEQWRKLELMLEVAERVWG